MSERDPRIDPRPGDVLRKGSSTIEVQTASIVGLSFKLDGLLSESPPMIAWCEPWIPSWRKWAKGAEVIKRGEE